MAALYAATGIIAHHDGVKHAPQSNINSMAMVHADELKAMIDTGERISVETDDLGGLHHEAGTQQALEQLRALPCVMSADYDGHELTVRCRRGDHNLLDVLTLLKSNGTNIGHLSSRQPTLNDVFLELTGTALRD